MKIFKAAGRRLKTCGLAVIASDPDKRAALAAAMDGFERDFLDELLLGYRPTIPHMLHGLMMTLNGHADRKTNPSCGRCSDSLNARRTDIMADQIIHSISII
jgi:hypothetical protein